MSKPKNPSMKPNDRTPAEPGHPGSDPIAWVVDDDPEMLELVALYLRTRGFFVEEFSNGDDLADALWFALELGGDPPPDLLVTDVVMPGQSGLDVTAMLRRGDWEVPVIVITGARSAEVESEARRLGVVDVLEKPFDMRRLGALAAMAL